MEGREDGFREKRMGLILESMIFLETIGQFSEHVGSCLDKMEFTIDMWAGIWKWKWSRSVVSDSFRPRGL